MKVQLKRQEDRIENVHQFLDILRARSSEAHESGRQFSADENYLGGTYLRGQGRDDWSLVPTIGREYSYAGKKISGFDEEQERLLFNRFRRQSFFHFNRVMTLWETVIVARHFGLPVRLLDWSSNPLVVLYWSCQSEKRKDGTEHDGALWLIARRPPADKFLDILSEESADPLAVRGIRTVVPLFVDRRLSAQASVFTIHENPRRPMDKVLADGIDEADCDIKEIIRWTVPGAKKPAILVELEKMGVNVRTLIPDLSGLCLGLWRTELARCGTPV